MQVQLGRAAVAVLAGWPGMARPVVRHAETTRPLSTERIAQRHAATARRPAMVRTEVGPLRFVEPLERPTEEITRGTPAGAR